MRVYFGKLRGHARFESQEQRFSEGGRHLIHHVAVIRADFAGHLLAKGPHVLIESGHAAKYPAMIREDRLLCFAYTRDAKGRGSKAGIGS